MGRGAPPWRHDRSRPTLFGDRSDARHARGSDPLNVSSLRAAVNDAFRRHEVAWELVMAALAIGYVVLGFLVDEGTVDDDLSRLETAITVVFVVEYVVRLWAAPSRLSYFGRHLFDLVALLPVARGLRTLRLLRLLRLVRTAPVLYRALGYDIPIVRRIGWHLGRAREGLDLRLLNAILATMAAFIVVGAVVVTLLEKDWTFEALGDSFYWATNTVLGSGDSSYVASPVGWLFSWLFAILGLTLLAIATGALVSFMIDYALKEGRGMGAAGFSDHVVVCGWNTSARELVDELRGDEYGRRVAVVADLDRNPAGDGIYFVSGDPTDPEALKRAGIDDAAAALVFPRDPSDAADMTSILIILAIESIAPRVRTIAEVNNSRHAEHFRRAGVDELLVPSRISAHLAARSALYPGLTELVTDIVSGGEGSELYRVSLPEAYLGLSVDELSSRLRADHHATLLAITRDGQSYVNPPVDFRLAPGDDALVVAESLGTLAPLQVPDAIEDAAAGAPSGDRAVAGQTAG